ncbi:MAG: exosome complex exonuclease Rrp41 [Candidatus Micrarchaeota archaeon]|nr:exosome complex exonuclease Rrp41 [Candidatus Micrarchaeota archaeon]
MSQAESNKPKLLVDGKRIDGRATDELRPIRIVARVLNDADGSAYVEWGKNKVLAGVYGPSECIPRHDQSLYRSVVRCRYNMAPFSGAEEHGRSGPSRRSRELSKVIKEAFENVIISENFPRTQIEIFVEVLQSDGGTRCAAITAASVALADAGIPMKDLITAVAVGKIDGQMAIDLGKEEDNFGESDMPLAFSLRTGELLLFQMDGLLTREELQKGIAMAKAAAQKVHKLQVEAIRKVYEEPREERFLPVKGALEK